MKRSLQLRRGPMLLLAMAALLVLGCHAYHLLLFHLYGREAADAVMPQVPAFIFLTVLLAVYGAAAMRYHPYHSPSYRDWLKLTPWTYRQPLPLGQVGFDVQDFAAIALILIYIRHEVRGFYLWSVLALLIGFVASALFVLAFTRPREGYLIAWGIGLAIRLLVVPPYWAVAIGLALFVCTQFALHLSLKSFPWEDAWPKKTPDLGREFLSLSPKPDIKSISPGKGFAIAVLIGWIAYALWSHHDFKADPDFARMFPIMTIFFVAMAALIRWALYADKVQAPTSLRGRWVTGRYFFPRYDAIFIAPLLMLIAAFVLPRMLPAHGVSCAMSIAIIITVELTLATEMPPKLHNVALSSEARLRVSTNASPAERRLEQELKRSARA